MSIPNGYDADLIEEYSEAGYWGNRIIPDYAARNATERAQHEAYVQGKSRLTWAEYWGCVNRLARAFIELGLKKEDRFAIYLPHWIEIHLVHDALSMIGVIAVAININQGTKETAYMLSLTDAAGIITPGVWRGTDYAALVRDMRSRLPGLRHHIVAGDKQQPDTLLLSSLMGKQRQDDGPGVDLGRFRPDPNDIFLMNFSSGTTGVPKCVLHTPNRWTYFSRLAIEGGALTEEDVILALVPSDSGFGFWSSHACPIMLAAKTILLEKFDAREALQLIEREKVTVVTAVTTQFAKMLEVPDFSTYDLASWRVMYTGGQDVPYERVRDLESKTGCTVLQFYGSIECGGVSRTVLGESLEKRTRTVGRPIQEMNVKFLDPATGKEMAGPGQTGEIACKGPSMSSGYYGDAAGSKKLFDSEGWMLTGDLGTIDEDGYLRLVGRVKDIIIRGGQNISAPEVEDAILTHPKVADVAVVAMPDPVFGEKACAYVVPRAGEQISFGELTAFLKGTRMATYKLPERLEILDALPISAAEKVVKSVLRKDIAEKLKNEGRVR